jgi:hypothetical protein
MRLTFFQCSAEDLQFFVNLIFVIDQILPDADDEGYTGAFLGFSYSCDGIIGKGPIYLHAVLKTFGSPFEANVANCCP